MLILKAFNEKIEVSEDLMNLFKSKTKKNLSETNSIVDIEATQANLDLKISDERKLIGEYEEINKSLRKEVELQKIKLQKTEVELKRLQSTLTDEHADKEILEKRIEKIQQLNSEQEGHLKELLEEKQLVISSIVQLKKQVEEINNSHRSNLDELGRIRVELGNLKGEELSLKNKASVLNGDKAFDLDTRSHLKVEIEETKKRISKLRLVIEEDNNTIRKCDANIVELENERLKLDAEISKLIEKTQEVVEKKHSENKKLEKLTLKVQDVRSEKLNLEKDLELQLLDLKVVASKQAKLNQDIIAVETSIKKLERESESLRSQEMSELEIVSGLESEISSREKKKQELLQDIQLLKVESQNFKDKIEENTIKSEQLEKQISELKETESLSLIEIDRLDREYKKTKREHDIVLAQSLTLEKSVQDYQSEVDRLDSSVEELLTKKHKAILNNENRETKISSLQNQIDEGSSRISEIRLEIQDLKGRDVEARQTLIDLGLEQKNVEYQKQALQDQAENLRKSIELLNNKIEKSQAAYELLNSDCESQNNLIKQLADDENALSDTNNELLVKIGSLKGRIQIGDNRIEVKGLEIEELAKENQRLNNISESLCDKLNKTVRMIESLDAKISTFESQIKALDFEINTNQVSYDEALVKIKEMDSKTLNLKDKVLRKSDELKSITSLRKRFERLANKKISSVESMKVELSELNEGIESESKLYTETLSRKRELDDELTSLNLEVSQRQEKSKKLQSEISSIEAMIESDEKTILQLEDSIINQGEVLERLESSRLSLLEQHKDLNNQQIVSNEELTKVENDCYSLRVSLADLEKEINEIEANLEANILRKVQLNEEAKKLESDTRIAKADIVKLNNEIEQSVSELKAVEETHKEKLELLQVELAEKELVSKEHLTRQNKLSEAKNLLSSVETELNGVLSEKELLKTGINNSTKLKGELLLRKDELAQEISSMKDANRESRHILSGLSLEISSLKNECSQLEISYNEELEKSKSIVSSIDILRNQARDLKTKQINEQKQLDTLKHNVQPAVDELAYVERQVEAGTLLNKLEVALSRVEFDANLHAEDDALILIRDENILFNVSNYLESLPFVFSKIDEVNINLTSEEAIAIAARGELRCDTELTKELLRDNVKGKFKKGLRFKISNGQIKVEILTKEKSLGARA